MVESERNNADSFRGISVHDVLARNGQEGYPRFGFGPKTQQRFIGLEQRILTEEHPGLLFELATLVNSGRSLRSIGQEYSIDAKLLGQFLQLAGISYPSKEEAVQILWTDPDFRARNAEATRAKANPWDDPEYRERMTRINGDNLRRQWSDPEYRQQQVEQARGRMVELWQDPAYREKTLAVLEATHRDPEVSRKRSETMRKRWQNPEFRNAQTDFSRKHFERLRQDPTFQERITATRKKRFEDPEERRRIVEPAQRRLRELWQDPEYRRQQSERSRAIMRALWGDPEFQHKVANARIGVMRQLWEDPDFRELQAALNRQRWEDPGFREKMLASNQRLWNDPTFREKIQAASAQARQERWRTDPEFAESMRRVLLDARLNPANREKMVLPTILGFRPDINFFAQSMWEANFARILMLVGRDFLVGEQLLLQVPEDYRDVIPDEKTTFITDFTTINAREDIVIYEIMAHPFKDPVGWAKFLIAKEQFPDLQFQPITRDDYKTLQARFEVRINNDPRFRGWETYKDNLRTNPTRYS